VNYPCRIHNVKLPLNPISQHSSVVVFFVHSDSPQEDPVAFERQYNETPVQALQRVEEVLSLYLHLITSTNSPVNWTCEQEYNINVPPTETQLTTSTGDCTHTHTLVHMKKKQVQDTSEAVGKTDAFQTHPHIALQQ